MQSGIEIKFRTADEWLFVAKGNMVTAVLENYSPTLLSLF